MKRPLTVPVLLLALLSLAPACPKPKPPTPTPIVTPAPSAILRVEVFEGDIASDHKAVGATVRLKDAHDVWTSFTTDSAGNVDIGPLPLDFYRLIITAEGYYEFGEDFVLTPATRVHQVSLLPRPPPFVPLPRLVTRGEFFGLETGERFTVVGTSDFNLLNRYLSNEDIEPILAQREHPDPTHPTAPGFNWLRVWTLFDFACPADAQGHTDCGIGKGMTLANHPDMYERIPAFLRLAAKHHLYVEFTAFIGGLPQDGYYPGHWQRLQDAVRGETNAVLELVNENDQHPIDLSPFAQPVGILSSRGSNGSEHPPVGMGRSVETPTDPQHWIVTQPPWGFLTSHTNGAFEESRKVGHVCMEYADTARVPCVGDETSRVTDQYNSPQRAFDTGAGCALLSAGCTLHSISGKNSTLWIGDELANAIAWAAGEHSIDLACQPGPYVHRQDLEQSTDLRWYERPVAGHVCTAQIRK
jgi:hypothetical protein